MIVRRFGSTVQSVEPNFDSRAMTEIGFLRTSALSIPWEDFQEEYERVDEKALTATADGNVKDEAEAALLASLREQLDALDAEAGDDLLLVENLAGQDYPKTRDRTSTRGYGHETRSHFAWTIDPPLKLGRYRRKTG
jgi:hypothetical protein